MGDNPSGPWRLRQPGDPPGVTPAAYLDTGLWEFASVYRQAAQVNQSLTPPVIDAMEPWEIAEALGVFSDEETTPGAAPPIGSPRRRNLAKERWLASKGLMPDPEPDAAPSNQVRNMQARFVGAAING